MNKRFFTLFVLTNDASRSRQLRIPFKVLKAGITAAVLFFAAITFIVFDYARIRTHSVEIYEVQGFAEKITELESRLAKLSHFDRKLRIIANIEEPKGAKGNSDIMMGMGGGSPAEDEAYMNNTPLRGEDLVEKMRSEITDLQEKAETQEKSFTELQGYLMKQVSFLASTPSIWPSRGWVTSTYGQRISPFTGNPQMHRGMDIANRIGTPVVAAADGIVVEAGADPGLGRTVVISHGYGIKTVYGHMDKLLVHSGQKVRRGASIGEMGNTGRSTGPHLHYEVSLNGVAVNPSRYILN